MDRHATKVKDVKPGVSVYKIRPCLYGRSTHVLVYSRTQGLRMTMVFESDPFGKTASKVPFHVARNTADHRDALDDLGVEVA